MSLVKNILEDAAASIAQSGEIDHEFQVHNMKVVYGPIKTEERFLANSLIMRDKIAEKYNYNELTVMRDTIGSYRNVAMIGLSIKTIDDKSPVDYEQKLDKQLEQRIELIMELMEMPVQAINVMTEELTKHDNKVKAFFNNVDEGAEKS